MGLVQAEWLSFARNVLYHAGVIQRQEMRRAFFDGAAAYHSIVMRELSEGEGVTAEDEHVMERLEAELRQFPIDVKEGRA
jgi:hypothetical protein